MWRKEKTQFRFGLPALLVVTGLVVSMLLSACGEYTPTPGGVATNAAGAANTASTAVAGGANAASTAVASGASTAGTAIAGAATTAGTAIAGAAQTAGTAVTGALTQAPTIAAGAAQTAGTAVSGALTPVPTATPASRTTPVGTTTTNTTPATSSSPDAVADYPGVQPITFTQTERDLAAPAAVVLNPLVNQPSLSFYRLAGVNDSKKVKDFYELELTSQGWYNQTDQVSNLVTQQAQLRFLGSSVSFYTKNNRLFVLAVSGPLSANEIQSGNLRGKLQPGDIAIMTMTGISKVNL
jgi:hypothetical protein